MPDGFACAQIHQFLIGGTNATVVQGALDLRTLRQTEALLGVGAFDLIAPAALGVIQQGVQSGDESLRGARRTGPGGDPEAGREMDGVIPVAHAGRGDGTAQALRDLIGFSQVLAR
ncbi:hypothetical protein GALL_485290 [mine drainage metagenome]|uniref:Uncharacterized protein n=1 Tax=mine drainage metagenome TaxID=410659 RepID=A0A1J5PQ23_9ZZZZ